MLKAGLSGYDPNTAVSIARARTYRRLCYPLINLQFQPARLYDWQKPVKFFVLVSRILIVIKDPANLLALAITLLCILLHVSGWETFVRFDRHAISAGNISLLLSGNFVHLGLSHLLLNMAGFILVVMLVWVNFNALEWLLVTLFCSIAVGTGLYLRDPEVIYYVGFSGTLHGLIIAGTLADFKRFPIAAAILLLLVVGKLGWEQLHGPLPGSETAAGGRVVVNSHLYGAIAGAVVGGILLLIKRIRDTQTPP